MTAPRDVTVRPAKVGGVLGAVVLGLVTFHLFFQYHRLTVASGFLSFGLTNKFDLDAEATVPAYFSALLLLGAALLLWSIASDQTRRRDWWSWGGLAVLFLLLSVDEAVDFHNSISAPLKGRIGNTRGALRSAWVIPAVAFLLVFAATYLRFFLRLPRRFQVLFALAEVLYVGGAVGGEMVGGWHIESHGAQNAAYILISSAEEAMEMAGVVVFIYALLLYKTLYGRPVQVQFGDPARPENLGPQGGSAAWRRLPSPRNRRGADLNPTSTLLSARP